MSEIKMPVLVRIKPDSDSSALLRRAVNLHYLGDEECNRDTDDGLVPKYPEKETEEFLEAGRNTFRTSVVTLNVVYDTSTGSIIRIEEYKKDKTNEDNL